MEKPIKKKFLTQRRAGVLLHPASLPGKQRLGDIGAEARNFMHFMADSGLEVWQMLPLGPTHDDGSPYQCLSSHAGNPELINLEWLQQQQWLTAKQLSNCKKLESNQPLLDMASERFFEQADAGWMKRFEDFIQQSDYWLSDYSLFMAIKKTYKGISWTEWPLCYRFRDEDSLNEARQQYADIISSVQFTQFVFFTQWQELREYARSLNILLFGDMPIYVAMDSVDVWSQKENFLMHADGQCDFVAGVPPDAFSDDGQYWGNPLYDWDYQNKNDFGWWKERFKTQLALFDLIRVDHFRGLEACWNIPANEDTAKNGAWVKTPGKALLNSLYQYFDQLPLVAEDLGVITPEVEKLRDEFSLPGMAILQFAFDDNGSNPYLPHNHKNNTLVYTGTHDNDTTLGWYQSLSQYTRKHLHEYMGYSESSDLDMPWALNRMAMASTARLAILPMQDLLALDSTHRMNTPGTTEGNWSWRFEWSQVWPGLAPDVNYMVKLYGRSPKTSD
jgi:4-alpha-glucanotransferase